MALFQLYILDLTLGFNALSQVNCKTRWESFKFWDLVPLILEVLWFVLLIWNYKILCNTSQYIISGNGFDINSSWPGDGMWIYMCCIELSGSTLAQVMAYCLVLWQQAITWNIVDVSLSGVPDYFDRNKISSGGDLSHYSSASLY